MVTVICPCSRPEYLPNLIANYLKQDYADRELLILMDYEGYTLDTSIDNRIFQWGIPNLNIGQKRNHLCEFSRGDIIVHMDDDDIYSKDWISQSVAKLQHTRCTGLREMFIHDTVNDKGYLWSYPIGAQPYLAEATLSYRKEHWQQFKHHNVQTGECTKLYGYSKPLDYRDGFIARIHGKNTSTHNQVHTFTSIDINVINLVYSKINT
jgi:glycosyltransferase involved in cell wall biosynthesis